ncbi:BMP family ABC transporter substrate-binding protein [Mycoplasma sp. ATU-Cv-508]|uniref:BMP family ABC transporter substrate-binding protein n=1 Tax=Mycoplasma sp. ATU-Cv-508 TaxID=2048001 RepID=UPI000FDEE8AD
MRVSKKFFCALIGGCALTFSVSGVLACGAAGRVQTFSKIGLVTDTGSLYDFSFNQQAWEAIQALDPKATQADSVVMPSSLDSSALEQGYKRFFKDRGKEIAVANGFYHAEAIQRFNRNNNSGEGVFILNDAELPAVNNVASIVYDTRTASFLAGYLVSLYLEARSDIYPMPKVGTWGAKNISNVTDFMIGFIYGVNYYNINRPSGKQSIAFGRFANRDSYTNSGFEKGGGTKQADELLAEGVSVLFPVAGIQTSDAISRIENLGESSRNTLKVVGVDSDMVLRYPDKPQYFLTSVIKNTKAAIMGMHRVLAGSPEADPDIFKGLGATTVGNLSNQLTGVANNSGSAAWREVSNSGAIYQKAVGPEIVDIAIKTVVEKTWDEALILLESMNRNEIRF